MSSEWQRNILDGTGRDATALDGFGPHGTARVAVAAVAMFSGRVAARLLAGGRRQAAGLTQLARRRSPGCGGR